MVILPTYKSNHSSATICMLKTIETLTHTKSFSAPTFSRLRQRAQVSRIFHIWSSQTLRSIWLSQTLRSIHKRSFLRFCKLYATSRPWPLSTHMGKALLRGATFVLPPPPFSVPRSSFPVSQTFTAHGRKHVVYIATD